MKVIKDICYGREKAGGQYLDIYLPNEESFKVFVYIHGGGLVGGDKADTGDVGRYLADHGMAFVSVNYRMYPDAVYPQFICDAAEAVGWVYENIGTYGSCEGIYIGGSSAGGYISMMLCFDKQYLAPYGLPDGVIKGYLHDAGQPTAHFKVLEKRGIDSRRIIVDETAPMYHVGLAQDYLPMMFVVSDNDMQNRFEQTQLMLSTLRHFGYDEKKIFYRLMNGTHCHYSQTSEMGEIICEFVEMADKSRQN